MLTFQVASGVLLSAVIALMTTRGMNIHRNNAGWRSLFGAAMFAFGVIVGAMVILAGATWP